MLKQAFNIQKKSQVSNMVQLKEAIAPYHERLQAHQIYKSVKTQDQLRVFMENH